MKANRKVILTVILAAAFFSINCSPQRSSDNFDPAVFTQSSGAVTLCFDLRNDASPKAGLLLKVQPKPAGESHTLALPFGSTNVSARREIYSTAGSYDSTTLVRFYAPANTAGSYEISVAPGFGTAPPQWSGDVRDLPAASLYFLKDNLTRHFIYKYPDADPNKKTWLEEIGKISDTNIDWVAVALPADSSGKEIKRTNKTAIPEPQILGDAKFFPATSAAINKTEAAIYVKYEVPPNNQQQVFIQQGVKSVISIIPLFVQFIIFLYGDTKNRRPAKILMWIFAGLQALIIAWLIYSVFSSWDESTVKSVWDLIIAIFTGTAGGILVYKGKKK
jgi:hypothetical protein